MKKNKKMINQTDKELINKYLSHKLNSEELNEFKKRLADAEFAKTVTEQAIAEVSLKEANNILISNLIKKNKQVQKRKTIWFSAAAILIIFIGLTSLLRYTNFVPSQSYDIQKIEISSFSNQYSNAYDTAFNYYQQNNYHQALIFFNKAISQNIETNDALLASAYILFQKHTETSKINYLDSCLTCLNLIDPIYCNELNNYYCKQINILKANCYLLKNERKKAHKLFIKLMNTKDEKIISYIKNENYFLWLKWKLFNEK